MATRRLLSVAGGLAALSLACLLVGFLAGRLPGFALEQSWLDPRPLDLASAPSEQVERMLLGEVLAPDAVVAVASSELRFQAGDRASLIEVMAARGETGITSQLTGYRHRLGAEQVGAALCAAARYGHGSTLEVLLKLDKANPATLRCRPEGLRPAELALETGHGSAAEMLAQHGF